MELFDDLTEDNQSPLGYNFSPSWNTKIGYYLLRPEFKRMIDWLEGRYKEANPIVYPNKEDVFKAFTLCDWHDTKVIMLGQDPYHNGNADGLAFSCKLSVSPSLKQIINGMAVNLNQPINPAQPKQLDYLAKQGVLLINSALTVDAGLPNSHQAIGWSAFIEAVLKSFQNKGRIVWILWGASAQGFAKYAGKSHLVLRCEHPVAASYANSKWVCDNFTTCNDYLVQYGFQPIKWLYDGKD